MIRGSNSGKGKRFIAPQTVQIGSGAHWPIQLRGQWVPWAFRGGGWLGQPGPEPHAPYSAEIHGVYREGF